MICSFVFYCNNAVDVKDYRSEGGVKTPHWCIDQIHVLFTVVIDRQIGLQQN